MSHNIDSIEIVFSLDFGISREKLDELLERYDEQQFDGEYIAEGNIFDMIADNHRDWSQEKNGFIYLYNFWWYGEWSGSSAEDLYKLLTEFEGDADLVLVWEGGEDFTGVRLRDGVVTHHKVEMSLGEEATDD
jgi:hypothetical protein